MKRLQIELPEDLHLAAKIKAAQTDTSMAEICRRALTAWLQGETEPTIETPPAQDSDK